MSKAITSQQIGRSLTPNSQTNKTFHHLAFAMATIIALGVMLTGFLGLYKIDFFSGIGAPISQGLAYGGIALLGVAFIGYVIWLCTCNKDQKPTEEEDSLSNTLPPEDQQPKAPINPPNPPSASSIPDPIESPDSLSDVEDEEKTVEEPTPEDPPKPPMPSAPPVNEPPATDNLKEVEPPPISPTIPLFTAQWQPLIALQARRNKSVTYRPPNESDLLLQMNDLFPIRTQELLNIRVTLNFFLSDMKSVYGALLEGEFKGRLCNQELDLEEKTLPANIVAQAQEFICKRIEAFNQLLENAKAPTLKIDTKEFFREFAQTTEKKMPECQLKHFKDTFIKQLCLDLQDLCKTSVVETFENSDFAEIESYISQEIATFNASMHQCVQDLAIPSLKFEDIEFATFHQVLELISIWFKLEGLGYFQGDVDEKINRLSQLCDDLSEWGDGIGQEYLNFKSMIIGSFQKTGESFFIGYPFYRTYQVDLDREIQVKSILFEIGRKLQQEPPELLINVTIGDDPEKEKQKQIDNFLHQGYTLAEAMQLIANGAASASF